MLKIRADVFFKILFFTLGGRWLVMRLWRPLPFFCDGWVPDPLRVGVGALRMMLSNIFVVPGLFGQAFGFCLGGGVKNVIFLETPANDFVLMCFLMCAFPYV